jgi:hypothetical protein
MPACQSKAYQIACLAEVKRLPSAVALHVSRQQNLQYRELLLSGPYRAEREQFGVCQRKGQGVIVPERVSEKVKRIERRPASVFLPAVETAPMIDAHSGPTARRVVFNSD